MSCGAEHSVGLSDTGVVYAWGWGSYGNLGDGERVDRWAPVKVRLCMCLQALAHDTADLAPDSICHDLHTALIMPLHWGFSLSSNFCFRTQCRVCALCFPFAPCQFLLLFLVLGASQCRILRCVTVATPPLRCGHRAFLTGFCDKACSSFRDCAGAGHGGCEDRLCGLRLAAQHCSRQQRHGVHLRLEQVRAARARGHQVSCPPQGHHGVMQMHSTKCQSQFAMLFCHSDPAVAADKLIEASYRAVILYMRSRASSLH